MLDLLLEGAYGVIALAAWRTTTGHYAWRIHESARNKRGPEPELEDWLGAGVFCLLLAAIWPVLLLVVVPWPWQSKTEVEGRKVAKQVHYKNLMLENDRRAKELDSGDVLNQDGSQWP